MMDKTLESEVNALLGVLPWPITLMWSKYLGQSNTKGIITKKNRNSGLKQWPRLTFTINIVTWRFYSASSRNETHVKISDVQI